jgi:hypothetical protein
MYKIVYVDEQQEEIDHFKYYIKTTPHKDSFEVKDMLPASELATMLESILEENPDAIVTDFMLNEFKTYIDYNVPYTGAELVKEFLKIREGFPCFVLTAFEESAILDSEDVNIVYIKDLIHEEPKSSKVPFLERIITQIDHYQSRIRLAEVELLRLMQLRRVGNATLREEEAIINLDRFLEASVNNKGTIPQDLKSTSNAERLEALLAKVDELLKKVKNPNTDEFQE